jgi:transposase
MRQSKDPKILRLRMAQDARHLGVKPTARRYRTSVATVRKWLRRFDGTLASLEEHSRRPRTSPRKISPAREKTILDLKKQLPRWSPRRLKAEFNLPVAEKTIRRVCRDHGLLRKYRRKKHQTKRLLREVKKHWRLFQQIEIDTKHLYDIPEYYQIMQRAWLPRYQYTARDVTTGLLFLAFAQECTLTFAELFARRIIVHLQNCGCDLAQTTWQSDNGSEFIGSWQAKTDSDFTQTIQRVPGQQHRTIPPGQHRFQADVETVHSLMETEFYEVESFADRDDFLNKAITYQHYFNLARKNSAKEYQTPWQLVRNKNPKAHPLLPLLEPVLLDDLHQKYLYHHAPGGYDVWALPYTLFYRTLPPFLTRLLKYRDLPPPVILI